MHFFRMRGAYFVLTGFEFENIPLIDNGIQVNLVSIFERIFSCTDITKLST